jgi:hypothetical protein
MPFEIPNYDSIVGRAARPGAEDPVPAPVSFVHDGADGGEWDPNRIELDLEELAACLGRS